MSGKSLKQRSKKISEPSKHPVRHHSKKAVGNMISSNENDPPTNVAHNPNPTKNNKSSYNACEMLHPVEVIQQQSLHGQSI